jgi:hypothetical protein
MSSQSSHLNEADDARAAAAGAELRQYLRAFAELCEEALTLAQQENQALTGTADPAPNRFDERRKTLLQAIEINSLRRSFWREKWSLVRHNPKVPSHDIKILLTDIQNLLMRVFQLERENQQARLRRGLVPPLQLPSSVSQQPHFVAGLYQRHRMGI